MWRVEFGRQSERRSTLIALLGTLGTLLAFTVFAVEDESLFWYHTLFIPLLALLPAILLGSDRENGMWKVMHTHGVDRRASVVGVAIVSGSVAVIAWLLLVMVVALCFGAGAVLALAGVLGAELLAMLLSVLLGLVAGALSGTKTSAIGSTLAVTGVWWLLYMTSADWARLRVEPSLLAGILWTSPPVYLASIGHEATLPVWAPMRGPAWTFLGALCIAAAFGGFLRILPRIADRERTRGLLAASLVGVMLLGTVLAAPWQAETPQSSKAVTREGIRAQAGGLFAADASKGVDEGRDATLTVNLQGPRGAVVDFAPVSVAGHLISVTILDRTTQRVELSGGPAGNLAVVEVPVRIQSLATGGISPDLVLTASLQGTPIEIYYPTFLNEIAGEPWLATILLIAFAISLSWLSRARFRG